jgi:hypothetical protein
MEEYVVIQGFSSYEVAKDGTVRNKTTKRALRPSTKGYPMISLTAPGEKRSRNVAVHRIVATAFVPNPEKKTIVNHLDGDIKNFAADNLEWVTRSENAQHAAKTGLLSSDRKGYCIECLDPTDQHVLRTFPSIREAARSLGLNPSGTGIRKALKSPGLLSGGYLWRKRGDEELPEEEWAPLVECSGYRFNNLPYSVSSFGRVRNDRTGHILAQSKQHQDLDYMAISLYVKVGIRKTFYVHRLVCRAFHGPGGESDDVDHINGKADDNRANNLQYVSRANHAKKTHGIPVIQLDEDHQVVGAFGSLAEASRAVRRANNLRRALDTPGRTCGGYTWVSADEPCRKSAATADISRDVDPNGSLDPSFENKETTNMGIPRAEMDEYLDSLFDL